MRAVPSHEPNQPVPSTRSGAVAIVGRPNVGKSTFLNAALSVELAVTSKTPQTTRTTLLGVVRREVDGVTCELRLLDTPGLHDASRTALNKRMNRVARAATADADVVVLMASVPPKETSRPLTPHSGDLAIAKELDPKAKVILVVNKIDRVKEKARLLDLLAQWSRVRDFESIVPISALTEDGVNLVLDEVARRLPEGRLEFEADDITDRPTRYFAAEYIREQVLKRSWEEVPHATTVSIDAFEENEKNARISATIHVERLGQKKILVGQKGSMLKEIGHDARMRMAELLGKPVHLELFVRETPNWRDNPQLLEELGYGEGKEPKAARPAKQKRK